jgi:hypothetical protein
MNKTLNLIRLGSFLSARYAGVDANSIKDRVQSTLQTAVANASTAKLGVMPFVQMLKEDAAALNINVTRNGDTVAVSPPTLDRPELAAKYAPLSSQIKTYLERYLEVFPSILHGEPVEYHNLTVTLQYPFVGGEPVATL